MSRFSEQKRLKAGAFNRYMLNPIRFREILRRAFSCDEVVRGPRTAHYDFNPGQMPGSHLIAVLVFLNFFVINQVGDIDEHSAGINFAAANVLINGRKNLVDLDGESAGLGLTFPLADRFFPQPAQVFTADCSRQLNLFHGFTQ